MKVLSLFDGISCGMVALERAGIPVERYVAYEIEPNAIKISKRNYPHIEHCGDVTTADFTQYEGFDLLIGGSPCQSLSIVQSKTRQHLDGKSKLFFQFVRALEETKPKYFLFENVASMNEESKQVISELLGCQPIFIDSGDFCAQERPRYYWTNIPVQLNYKKSTTVLADVLESEVESKYFYNHPLLNVDMSKQVCAIMQYKNHEMHKRIFNPAFKVHTLTTCGGGNTQKKVYINGKARKLTPLEYERLQTLPDGYTEWVADSHRYNALGNGWTVDVIAHIFKGLKQQEHTNERKLKVLELFAGTRSIGKAFGAKGHEVFSVEWDKDFENINLYADINTITAEDILQKFGRPDVIWASPDCSTFSIAAISHHRRKNEETGNLDPVSDYAKFCDEVDQHVLQLIKELNPTFYFIENPRGGMRKMTWMKDLPRYTVTYCQYGDKRMKPTDIWTNHPDPQFKPMCKNGDPCHEKAPRGSKTGTQGLKGSKERSVIPETLCQHIVDICEKYINTKKEKEMELKVKTPTFPEVIEFNFEELKKEITERASAYVNLVYTEDQIQDAKKDRATLNKFVKALSDERIKIKKECLKPYEDFEKKIKELDGIVNTAIKNIDDQVKGYEEQKKADKLAAIKGYWKSCEKPFDIPFEKVMSNSWLNASVSLKTVYGAIDVLLEGITKDLATLQNLPEFSFEAVEVYKTTLDMNKAISEGQRLADIQKRKAEQERIAAERKAEMERQKAEAEMAKHMNPPVEEPKVVEDLPTEPLREAICFRAYLTTEDALALKEFFTSRKIPFEAI